MEVLCALQVEIVSGLKFDYKRENNFKILCRSILNFEYSCGFNMH